MTDKEMIRHGKKLLQKHDDRKLFSNFSNIYPMTTENIKGTYDLFDLNDKNVLTVTSSGDHILEAALAGAKTIDSFDINYLSEYYYHFKKAIIESYSLDMFKKILFDDIILNGIIDDKYYANFRDKMATKYQMFWDEIIEYSLSNNLALNTFMTMGPDPFYLLNYLHKENYDVLKEKLSSVNTGFIHSDLLHLGKSLTKKYDFMFFSNIADYIGITKTKQYAATKLMKNLSYDGTIVYAYMYDAERKIVKRFEKTNFYMIDSAYNNYISKDYVLTIRRNYEWDSR